MKYHKPTLLESSTMPTVRASIHDTETVISLLSRLRDVSRKGSYGYFMPDALDTATANLFQKSTDALLSIHATVISGLVAYNIRNNGSAPLDASMDGRSTQVHNNAFEAASGLIPVSITLDEKSSYEPDHEKTARQGNEVFRTLVDKHIPNTLSEVSHGIDLLYVFPRNEIDILNTMIFEETAMPFSAIEDSLDELNYDIRSELLKTYLTETSRQESALSGVTYALETTLPLQFSYELKQVVQDLNIVTQEVSPRQGYDIPTIVQSAGLSELYESSFDQSYELYSKLQMAGFDSEAQYACLLGHRQRSRLKLNAAQLAELFSNINNFSLEGQRNLKIMHAEIAKAHPLIMYYLWPAE